jgi:hypothetical protein
MFQRVEADTSLWALPFVSGADVWTWPRNQIVAFKLNVGRTYHCYEYDGHSLPQWP